MQTNVQLGLVRPAIISSDSHIIEPPDLWLSRIDARYRHRAPQVARIDGNDWWVFDGERIGSVSGRRKRSGSYATLPDTVASRGAVLTHSTFDDVDPAAYTPSLYLAANRIDGVAGAVIRPTQGITNYCIAETELFGAICRAYNDWIADFCTEDRDALKAIAMLNNYDPDEAVREIERASRLGLVGGMIACYPGADIHYGHPRYERLWAAAAAHRFPISLHVLTNHNGPYGVNFTKVTYSLRVNADHWARMSLADMIFAGVFERHPGLVVESSEHEGGWVPYFLWQMDWTWQQRIRKRAQATATPSPPSTYFRNNVYVSIIYDPFAIEARHRIGVDRLMWGSDYPHEQSTQPNSLAFLAELLREVPSNEAQAIVFDNAAALYGFDERRVLAGLAPALAQAS